MNEINILDGYATRKQIADAIGVTERTISRWTDLRDGLPVTKIGNRVLYRVEAVRAWIAAREVSRNPSHYRRAA